MVFANPEAVVAIYDNPPLSQYFLEQGFIYYYISFRAFFIINTLFIMDIDYRRNKKLL